MKKLIKKTVKTLVFAALGIGFAAVPFVCAYTGHDLAAIAVVVPCACWVFLCTIAAVEAAGASALLGRLAETLERAYDKVLAWARN